MWKPGKGYGDFLFGTHINSIQGFKEKFTEDSSGRTSFDGELGHTDFVSKDGNLIISTEARIITSIAFWEEFYISENIIGMHFHDACKQIQNVCGSTDLNYAFENQVTYPDGSVQMQIEFENLGLLVSVYLNGLVVGVSIIPDEKYYEDVQGA